MKTEFQLQAAPKLWYKERSGSENLTEWQEENNQLSYAVIFLWAKMSGLKSVNITELEMVIRKIVTSQIDMQLQCTASEADIQI